MPKEVVKLDVTVVADGDKSTACVAVEGRETLTVAHRQRQQGGDMPWLVTDSKGNHRGRRMTFAAALDLALIQAKSVMQAVVREALV